MRTFPAKYFSDLPVSKEVYEIDLAVLERYQLFAEELLRLSLAALAGYGFLIVNVFLNANKIVQLGSGIAIVTAGVMGVGAIALTGSAACALGYRYFSTDAFTHHVRRLRGLLQVAKAKSSEEKIEVEKIVAHESDSLDDDLKSTHRLLGASAVLLFTGVFAVAVAFAAVLTSLAF